jgi:hypothetical protein
MEMLNSVIAFVQFLITAVLVMAGLLIVLAIVVSILPKDNPLQQLFMAFTKRLAVMVGISVVAVPVEFIPMIDVLYDLAALIFTGWYWFKLIPEVRDILAYRASRAEPPSYARAPVVLESRALPSAMPVLDVHETDAG